MKSCKEFLDEIGLTYLWYAIKDSFISSNDNVTSGNIATWNSDGKSLNDSGFTIGKSVPSDAQFTDTKNTAGSTNTTDKIYVVGTKTLGDNPLSYSNSNVSITNGLLTADAIKKTDGTSKQILMADGSIGEPISLDDLGKLLVDYDMQTLIDNDDELWYGVEFDVTVSSPTTTRIGNLYLHQSLPILNQLRGCLLADDGTIVKYLNPNDWTNEDCTGLSGQVMVEIPSFYIKYETDGNIRRIKLSEFPITGYSKVPRMYVSAYEAALDRTNSKLASVRTYDMDYSDATLKAYMERFRGGANDSSWDNTYRSVLGRPATNISRTNFLTYAHNREISNTNYEWCAYWYECHKILYWLFVVEYATLNSQATYNAQLTSNGYRLGGLDYGVTNWSSSVWNSFNSYRPFVPCGYTDSLGNSTGIINYTASNNDAITVTSGVPRYRGVENPFGHIWKWSVGVNVENGSSATTNLSKIYTTSDVSKFNTYTSVNSSYDGYTHVGNEVRSSGWMVLSVFGNTGEIIPSTVGGTSSTYYCDYHYTSTPSSGTQLRGVLFGGSAFDGSNAGFVCATSGDAPSDARTNVGSRLCFLPKTS